MLQRFTFSALVYLVAFVSSAQTKPIPMLPAKDSTSKTVEDLIEKLGSTKFQERNAAQKELEAFGASALPQLKKAAQTTDLETSKRAGELVRKIEERIFTAALLAPKRVHLNLKEVPALDAVNELAKLSGYQINVIGDRTQVADKKITLDTGDVAFWEAFDKLCAAVGLVEQTQVPTPVNGRINVLPAFPGGNLPGGILPVVPPKRPQPGPDLRPDIKRPAFQGNTLPAAPTGRPILAGVLAAAQLPVGQVQLQPPKVQVQVQAQAWQPMGLAPSAPTVITVLPGTAKNQHVSYAGAVRSRVFPIPGQAGEYRWTLEASAEPRLQGFTMVGTPAIDKAVDDQDQKLIVNPEPLPAVQPRPQLGGGRWGMLNGNLTPQRQFVLRFKAGAAPSKNLKELAGHFTAQVFAPAEALVTVENVLKANGETVKGASGGVLRVSSIVKEANGDYKLDVFAETPPGPNNGNGMMGNGIIQMQQVQIQVGGFGGAAALGNLAGLPELLDAKGRKFQPIQVPNRRMNFIGGVSSQEMTIVYRPHAGQGEPERLVLNGTRTVNVTIPFAFNNVPVE